MKNVLLDLVSILWNVLGYFLHFFIWIPFKYAPGSPTLSNIISKNQVTQPISFTIQHREAWVRILVLLLSLLLDANGVKTDSVFRPGF